MVSVSVFLLSVRIRFGNSTISSKCLLLRILSTQNAISSKCYPLKMISPQNAISSKCYFLKMLLPQNAIFSKCSLLSQAVLQFSFVYGSLRPDENNLKNRLRFSLQLMVVKKYFHINNTYNVSNSTKLTSFQHFY